MVDASGVQRPRLSRRDWTMIAVALTVVLVVLLVAGHGLARGALGGEVLGVRLGGDAQRTRIVIDLDHQTQGRVLESGSEGRVVLALANVASRRPLEGQGRGLVRDWRVRGSGGNAQLELDLASGVEIERRFMLAPGDGVDHFRYVMDLRATGPRTAAVATDTPATPHREALRRNERPLIVIDAGHGGRDPGAAGANARESAVTLAAALVLRSELERTGRYRVRLTRDGDAYVGLYRRVEIARQAGADLFISLHADAGSDPATRGASVYTLSDQGAGRAAREFTRSDNWQRSLNLPGRDESVDRILLDMTQRATQNRSARLARTLLGQLEQADHPLLRRSHRDAGLAVLLAPDVPAVLLEMGFITNPEDEQLLTSARARTRMMQAVVQGIDSYFRQGDTHLQMAETGSSAGQP
jgi:N-acetylmuramoyl-L-alanine amidase